MQISREVKVGALAALCLFLLYFGFKFLKGVNIFNPIHSYSGQFVNMRGLQEQAPVYVRGFKVGQVEEIDYDMSRDTAFTVVISINRDIRVLEGSRIELMPDGLLGGMAVELVLPFDRGQAEVPLRTVLPTGVQPGLIDQLQTSLLASVDSALFSVRELVENINRQIDGDELKHILANIDDLSVSLKHSATKLEGVMDTDLPVIVEQVDSVLSDVRVLTANLAEIDAVALAGQVDSAVKKIDGLIEAINSPDGTIGKLIHDGQLYEHLDNTVTEVDSLIQETRQQPNMFIWGKKKRK